VTDAISREWISFGGIVRDAGEKPVDDAWVSLEWVDNSRVPPKLLTVTTRTADGGRFIFERVARRAGYTLRARSPGHQEANRVTDLLAPSGEYDLQFP
jgi:hypothetical protein